MKLREWDEQLDYDHAQYDWQKPYEKTAKQFFEVLGHDTHYLTEMMGNAMDSAHRCTQSDFWKMIHELMRAYVKSQSVYLHTDPSNEAAIAFCKEVLEKIPEWEFP